MDRAHFTASRLTRRWLGAAALLIFLPACSVPTDLADLDGQIGDDGFSVASSLAEIPASAIGDRSFFEVSMADVDAAADIARVRRPAQMDDAQQVIDFVAPMTGFSRDERMRIFVLFPPPLIQSASEPGALIEEFGFALGEINTFVALSSVPGLFMVLTGVEPRQDLPQVAPGITSVGEGEDFAMAPNDRSAVRELGRPFRVAVKDERVGISLETAPLAAWSDDSAIRTLADDDSLLAIAQLLDERNVVSATVSSLEPQGLRDYEAVGIGWTEDDDGALSVIVLSYPSAGAAADNLDTVTSSFGANLDFTDTPLSDRLTLESIEQRDAEIVAVVRFPPESSPRWTWELLARGDGPFA